MRDPECSVECGQLQTVTEDIFFIFAVCDQCITGFYENALYNRFYYYYYLFTMYYGRFLSEIKLDRLIINSHLTLVLNMNYIQTAIELYLR